MTKYKLSEPVRFLAVLTELKEWGVKDTELSDAPGVERTLLGKLRSGERNEPTYNSGANVLAVCKREKRKQNGSPKSNG